jgi:hypothetical protein
MTVRPFSRLPLVALALLLLSACADMPDTARTGTKSPGQDSASAPASQPPATLAPGSITDPARLKGLSPVQLRTVLGNPGFRRRDAPGEIWQYRGGHCILDLFLYDESDGQKVEYYSVRSSRPIAEQDCLADLLRRKQTVPVS